MDETNKVAAAKPSAYEAALLDIQEVTGKATRALLEARPYLDALDELLGLLGKRFDYAYGEARAWFGWQQFSFVGPVLTVYVKTVESLEPIFWWLRGRGYKPTGDTGKEAEFPRLTYKFGPITIMAILDTISADDGGPRCRRVQVGVREEPVYEIRCEDPATVKLTLVNNDPETAPALKLLDPLPGDALPIDF